MIFFTSINLFFINPSAMSHLRKSFSQMTDDEITNWQGSISSAEDTDGAESIGDFDSDDDVADPDWDRTGIGSELDQLLQYDSSEISVDASLNVINLGLNEAGTSVGLNDAETTTAPSPLHLSDNLPEFAFETEWELLPADFFENVSDEPSTTSVATTSVTGLSRFRKRKRTSSIGHELQEEEGGPNTSTTGEFTGAANEMRNDSAEFKNLLWEKRNLQVHVNEIVFRGQKEMPPQIAALKTPYDCFDYFVTDEFLRQLADQMNLYAHQINDQTQFNTTAYEVRKFIGILFLMSMYRYPNVRAYWGKYAFSPITNTLTRARFEEMRQYLHFNDNSAITPADEPGHDKLHRVRPLITHFNERFGSVPMLQRLCVDEQMCATKMGGNPTRQYMPAKPHKWGTKLFVLCDSTGFSYAFEIYSGAGDNVIPENAPDLGASSNVVVRLSAKIPDHINHILYFDNFYTSLGLLTYLRSRGIYSLRTLRANRVPNIKLSSDAELARKKVERGYSEEYVANAFGIDISSVLWRDNKTVRLLSTYVGVKPFLSRQIETPTLTSKRWDRKTKQKVDVDCPFIIKEYNRHMGGVDLMDGLIGRYHIRMKTRKWTNKLFFHMLDVAMVNAYILHNRLHPKVTKELQDFRIEVAESLCSINAMKNKVGRPTLEALAMEAQYVPPKKNTKVYLPTAEVRFDGMDHWCIFLDRTGKRTCKFPGCKSETQAYCTKCNMNLCNSTTKSCFYKFHNNHQ